MSRQKDRENDSITLDDLFEEIIVDAYGEDEQLSAFCQIIEDEVPLPADGFVIGQPVSVVEIDYDGNERRGRTHFRPDALAQPFGQSRDQGAD